MMRRRALLMAMAFAALPAAASAQAGDGLRVMAFNVRLPLESDGPNRWEARQELFVETIRRTRPDIIGAQELWKIQGDHVIARLPQFSWFGIDRRGGHGDEHMGVFYRRDRLKLVEMGNFWLSETPEVPGSNSWGESLPRMATWGLFETVPGGKRFWFVNTHFAHRPEDESARTKAAELIAAWIAARPGGLPVVLTGDFNTVPDSAAHRALSAGLADAWDTAKARKGPAETFHGFNGKADRRIDWVFSKGLAPAKAETVTFGRGGRYPSDHFPVVVDYRWP
jgi:endonuclease/exonuclease/phosphatase family metal-dependent hydrolase